MCSRTSAAQDKEVFPFLIDYVPEFAIRKCKEELNESPERKERTLHELRSLLHENENTSGLQFHEDFLIQFLRRNKYRIPDTFQHFQNFVVLNKKESYLFKSILDHYFETISSKYMVLLPKRCPDGCAIVIFEVGKICLVSFLLSKFLSAV
ncbi:hypothetical protein AVEN_40855-1 [Araneus ventricosus]|uniref:CRAL/TRIO N-terminal domain-containing protein n=1 Tax=Araneus ventricosus TaxID=182803 RepID=A0A4Y2L4L0_ARAVE|nr:hypothetical protein AVEN_40855-1 [Araneus ventricosus]